ncbi:mRNA-degrading endonuclease [Planctomycetales bacterium]|nr:mRNA-degrading endonuclease [Planctomycetales bacterium]GHS96719.1 mRNA-degrading endonuclease [Planctomycetales bacterium]GHT06477.1 mRNA-degrading endonuclease [Planctomycetales bacterium]
MVIRPYVPDRGDLIWLDFDPQSGHEQRGKRPAIVLSPKGYNEKVGLGIFCPITSHIKGYPFEVKIRNSTIQGVVLADQIKSLDWTQRNAIFIAKATEDEIKRVTEKVTVLIDG